MTRKNKPDQINLNIYDVEPFVNEKYVGFTISWDSKIGFGQYTIYKHVDSDVWMADSEHMDINEDKAFIEELFKVFVSKLSIVG